jgi:NAD(P)-dependent dehydrogenase (short-subunit alcohol dehydrogenase family)
MTNDTNTPGALPLRMDGRTAFVAGGGSAGPGWSIGRASSVTYARLGARVCVADRDADSANETVSLICKEGGQAIAVVGDASIEADVARMFAEAREKLGPIDVLHYNVGIGKTGGPLETSAADLARIHGANVGGLLLATQAVLPQMKERRTGAIVAISSIAARRYLGYPHLAYGVTKAAVEQFIRLIALEYAPFGIRANTVVPGLIDTPRIAQTVAKMYDPDDLDEARQARASQVPNGRMGTAWDIAHACAFLASDAASYINGTELLVDGGITGKFV